MKFDIKSAVEGSIQFILSAHSRPQKSQPFDQYDQKSKGIYTVGPAGSDTFSTKEIV